VAVVAVVAPLSGRRGAVYRIRAYSARATFNGWKSASAAGEQG
jgi:hypothetical protein